MIGGSILGGLGNMMFVIAAVENLARSNGAEAFFPNTHQHLAKVQNDRARIYPDSDVSTQDYLKIFRGFNWPSNGEFSNKLFFPFHYTPLPFRDGTIYHGYFQSEQYFPDRNLILNLFAPSDFVLEKITRWNHLLKGTTCSIHVRRGDYSLDQNSKHHTKGMEWYNKAMDLVKADRYIVFCDDKEYAKANFIGSQFFFVDDKDYVELFLMSMCHHNIIASSSFSWWGAWLNKNPDKKVITPAQWFGPSEKDTITKDIIPNNWIKI